MKRGFWEFNIPLPWIAYLNEFLKIDKDIL